MFSQLNFIFICIYIYVMYIIFTFPPMFMIFQRQLCISCLLTYMNILFSLFHDVTYMLEEFINM